MTLEEILKIDAFLDARREILDTAVRYLREKCEFNYDDEIAFREYMVENVNPNM
jgi:hypothetical protein